MKNISGVTLFKFQYDNTLSSGVPGAMNGGSKFKFQYDNTLSPQLPSPAT